MAANDDAGRSPDAFVRIDAQWAPILEDALIDALQRYDAIHSAWAREHPELAERTRGRQGCDRRFGRAIVQAVPQRVEPLEVRAVTGLQLTIKSAHRQDRLSCPRHEILQTTAD